MWLAATLAVLLPVVVSGWRARERRLTAREAYAAAGRLGLRLEGEDYLFGEHLRLRIRDRGRRMVVQVPGSNTLTVQPGPSELTLGDLAFDGLFQVDAVDLATAFGRLPGEARAALVLSRRQVDSLSLRGGRLELQWGSSEALEPRMRLAVDLANALTPQGTLVEALIAATAPREPPAYRMACAALLLPDEAEPSHIDWAIGHASAAIRLRAARLHPEGRDVLVRLARDAAVDSAIRGAALRALGTDHSGDSVAESCLVHAAGGGPAALVAAACEGLLAAGRGMDPAPLLARFDLLPEGARGLIVRYLRHLPQGEAPLLTLLPGGRLDVIAALGAAGGPASLAALRRVAAPGLLPACRAARAAILLRSVWFQEILLNG